VERANGKVIGKPPLYATAKLEAAVNLLVPAVPVIVVMDGCSQQGLPNFLNSHVVGIPRTPRPTIYTLLCKADSEANL